MIWRSESGSFSAAGEMLAVAATGDGRAGACGCEGAVCAAAAVGWAGTASPAVGSEAGRFGGRTAVAGIAGAAVSAGAGACGAAFRPNSQSSGFAPCAEAGPASAITAMRVVRRVSGRRSIGRWVREDIIERYGRAVANLRRSIAAEVPISGLNR